MIGWLSFTVATSTVRPADFSLSATKSQARLTSPLNLLSADTLGMRMRSLSSSRLRASFLSRYSASDALMEGLLSPTHVGAGLLTEPRDETFGQRRGTVGRTAT